MNQIKTPWLYKVPGWELYAGEYPGAVCVNEETSKIYGLIKVGGVRTFVDLTQPGEHGLYSYLETVHSVCLDLGVGGVVRKRVPIPDGGLPRDRLQMRFILDYIKVALRHGAVYVHCFGGHGRTGTVIGCWLVDHGMDPEEALHLLEDLRAELPDRHIKSPTTARQIEFVRKWKQGRDRPSENQTSFL